MNDTRQQIIRLASRLIRSVGYNSFSYADISRELNIKNAAIHYYFPVKSDLGAEIIQLNKEYFVKKVVSWKTLSYRQQYMNYLTMHDNSIKNYWACIVGSLSPSYDTFPENMQQELEDLINTIISWLTDILIKGKDNNEFNYNEKPRDKAYTIHSALLSSLLMNKVLKNDVYYSVQKALLNI